MSLPPGWYGWCYWHYERIVGFGGGGGVPLHIFNTIQPLLSEKLLRMGVITSTVLSGFSLHS